MRRIFTEASDLKLIKLVHDNPLLYDYRHEKYMDYNAREVLWQKIGDELKKCAVDCKVRWINIRDVHRRILKQELQEPGKRLHQYKYGKELAFMKTYYRDITSSNENDNEEYEEEQEEVEKDEPDNEIEYFDVNIDCPSDDSEVPIKKIKVKREKGKNKKKSKRKEVIETEDTTIQSTSSEIDITDPVDTFLLSIGTTLKKLTPYRLNLAKTQIFSIVQEHEYQQIVQSDNNTEKGKGNGNQKSRSVKQDETF